jgi:hypothetical protein
MVFTKQEKEQHPTIFLYDRAGNSGKASRLQAGVAWTDNITATVNTANDEMVLIVIHLLVQQQLAWVFTIQLIRSYKCIN